MALSDHMLETGDHGRLSFHLDCPVCRQRLRGAAPRGALVSPRARAALAAGVISAATFVPAGTAIASDDITLEPTRQGPDQAPAPADEPESEGTQADEQEAAQNLDDGPPDPGEPVDDLDPPLREADPAGVPAPPPAAAPAPPAAPQAPPAAQGPTAPRAPTPTPPETQAPASRVSNPAPKRGQHHAPGKAPAPTGRAAPGPSAPAPAQAPTAGRPVVSPPAQTSGPVAAPVAAVPARSAAPSDSKVPAGTGARVVQPGESLWTIASNALGEGATRAEIGSMVNRLWQLNADRIGTGDPDLVRAGQELMIPK